MKVLFASSECTPFYKVGGLGDVVGSLPQELVRQGVETRVVLPFYGSMAEKYKTQLVDVCFFYVYVGWRRQYCGVKKLQHHDVTYYFIDNQYYFNRERIYGYDDDGERFAFFNLAVIEMLEKINYLPDILHVHDWHTAMIPVLLKDKYHWIESFKKIKTVLTIHNMAFQGVFNKEMLFELFGTGMNVFTEDGVKYYDAINFLKGGIQFSDYVTTVSPTYMEEIQTPEKGEHLDGVLRANSWKLKGVLNGLDYQQFDPETDALIDVRYSATSIEYKGRNKKRLQKEMGLAVKDDIPLLGIVSRLTDQKGMYMFVHALERLMERDIQLIVLGSGEGQIEHDLCILAEKYSKKMAVYIGFNEALAQKIYSASDMYIMPSKFEPCGLSQLIALRYGAVPIVSETGGLKDTIVSYNEWTNEGTGFSFYDYREEVLLETIDRAVALYNNQQQDWQQLVRQGMAQDFSWHQSANEYRSIYRGLLNDGGDTNAI